MSAFQTAKHLLAPLSANCRDFHEQWQRVSENQRLAAAAPDADGIAGLWQGEWLSAVTGHRGPLRSVIVAASADRWLARFHASYSRIFRACYATELRAMPGSEGNLAFSGSSDLGWMAGGVYEYDGESTGPGFVCRYRSRFDNGEFRLDRITAL